MADLAGEAPPETGDRGAGRAGTRGPASRARPAPPAGCRGRGRGRRGRAPRCGGWARTVSGDDPDAGPLLLGHLGEQQGACSSPKVHRARPPRGRAERFWSGSRRPPCIRCTTKVTGSKRSSRYLPMRSTVDERSRPTASSGAGTTVLRAVKVRARNPSRVRPDQPSVSLSAWACSSGSSGTASARRGPEVGEGVGRAPRTAPRWPSRAPTSPAEPEAAVAGRRPGRWRARCWMASAVSRSQVKVTVGSSAGPRTRRDLTVVEHDVPHDGGGAVGGPGEDPLLDHEVEALAGGAQRLVVGDGGRGLGEPLVGQVGDHRGEATGV